MNPALSPHTTGLLPRRPSTACTSASTTGSVTTVRTTSTSCWTGAGLKKWMPTTRPGCEVAVDSSVTESDEVLVARIVLASTIESSSRKICCLVATDSTTASMTRSAPARSPSEVVVRIRPTSSAASSSVSLPRATARPVDASRWRRPRAAPSSSSSTPTTSKPWRAKTSAMPAPIVPRPTTPMVVKSREAAGVAAVSGEVVMARIMARGGPAHRGVVHSRVT